MKKYFMLIVILILFNLIYSQHSEKRNISYYSFGNKIEFYEDSTFRISSNYIANSTRFGKYQLVNNCGYLLLPLYEKPRIPNEYVIDTNSNILDTNYYFFKISVPNLKKFDKKIVYRFQISYHPNKNKSLKDILNDIKSTNPTIEMIENDLIDRIVVYFCEDQITYIPECKILKNDNFESIDINLYIYYDMKEVLYFNRIENVHNNLNLKVPKFNDKYLKWYENNFYNSSFIQIIDENTINWNGDIYTKDKL